MIENTHTFSFQRIAHNALLLFAGRVAAGAAHLLTMTLIARMLGVEDYGKFIFSLTYVSFFNHLSMFGIDIVLVREISRRPAACSRLVSSGMILKLAFTAAAVLLASAPLPIVDMAGQSRMLIGIFLVSMVFNSLRTPRVVFEAHLEAFRSMSVEFAGRCLTLVGMLGAFRLGFSLEGVALAYVLCELPSLWLLFRLARRHFSFVWAFDPAIAKSLIRESWPLALMSFIIAVYFRIDTLMLAFFKGDAAVGLYNAAYLVLTSLMLFPDAYVRSIFPAMSKAYPHDRLLLQTTFRGSLKYLAAAGLWVVVVGFLFAEEIIALLFGDAFRSAYESLRILIFASGVLFISPLVSNTLTAVNKQTVNLYLGIANLGLNILLNLVLIPNWGHVGAGIATLATEGFGCGMALYFSMKALGLSSGLQDLIRQGRLLAAAGGAMLVFVMFNAGNPIAGAALVSLAYLAGTILVRWFDGDDLSRIKRLLRGRA